jgi:hypothetical protein
MREIKNFEHPGKRDLLEIWNVVGKRVSNI